MTEPWGKEGRAALAELKANLPTITKKQRGQVGTRIYAYSDSAAVHTVVDPVMAKAHLLWEADPLIREDGLFVLRWTLTHLPTGQAKTGDWQIRSETSQGQGSEITYAERYAFKAVTGVKITGDDDDGHQATRRPVRADPEHERLIETTGGISAEHGKVEGTQRRRRPPADDLWRDQPPGHLDETPPEDRAGTMDGRQRSMIFAKFKILGVTTADPQRVILSDILRRKVTSRAELSYTDAQEILADLDARIEAKEAAETAAAQDAAAEQVTP